MLVTLQAFHEKHILYKFCYFLKLPIIILFQKLQRTEKMQSNDNQCVSCVWLDYKLEIYFTLFFIAKHMSVPIGDIAYDASRVFGGK